MVNRYVLCNTYRSKFHIVVHIFWTFRTNHCTTAVLISNPIALSASGSAVRLWNIENGTCLKLLQHSVSSPILSMSWIPSFNGVFSLDSENTLRTFNLNQVQTCQGRQDPAGIIQEIVKPSSSKKLENTNLGVVVKLDAIPNQLSIISLKTADCDFPSVNLKFLDYVD